MAFFPNSKALVPYDPTLPYFRALTRTEAATNTLFKHFLSIASLEARSLDADHRRLCQVLPSLKGPCPVGYSHEILSFPSSMGDQKIGVETYAPAANSIGKSLSLQIYPGHYLEKTLTTHQKNTLQTHVLDQIPIDPQRTRPLIIFSHGLGVNPTEYRPLLEELASHGLKILNLNHPFKLCICTVQQRSFGLPST